MSVDGGIEKQKFFADCRLFYQSSFSFRRFKIGRLVTVDRADIIVERSSFFFRIIADFFDCFMKSPFVELKISVFIIKLF